MHGEIFGNFYVEFVGPKTVGKQPKQRDNEGSSIHHDFVGHK